MSFYSIFCLNRRIEWVTEIFAGVCPLWRLEETSVVYWGTVLFHVPMLMKNVLRLLFLFFVLFIAPEKYVLLHFITLLWSLWGGPSSQLVTGVVSLMRQWWGRLNTVAGQTRRRKGNWNKWRKTHFSPGIFKGICWDEWNN